MDEILYQVFEDISRGNKYSKKLSEEEKVNIERHNRWLAYKYKLYKIAQHKGYGQKDCPTCGQHYRETFTMYWEKAQAEVEDICLKS